MSIITFGREVGGNITPNSEPLIIDEDKCLNIKRTKDIKCINVTSEAYEECITWEANSPSINVEPNVAQPEGCTEYSERPEFEITTVNGVPPTLDVNLDADGKVYLKDNDSVLITITNYEEDATYDTPYTSLDNILQEELGSNYLFDNGDGTLTLNIGNTQLDGIDIAIWLYVKQKGSDKCRNRSEKWTNLETMERSNQPIISNPIFGDSGTEIDFIVDNFNEGDEVIFGEAVTTNCVNNGSLISITDGVVKMKLPYSYNTYTYFVVYLRKREPLKYESFYGSGTILVVDTFNEDYFTPILRIDTPNDEAGVASYTIVVENYRPNYEIYNFKSNCLLIGLIVVSYTHNIPNGTLKPSYTLYTNTDNSSVSLAVHGFSVALYMVESDIKCSGGKSLNTVTLGAGTSNIDEYPITECLAESYRRVSGVKINPLRLLSQIHYNFVTHETINVPLTAYIYETDTINGRVKIRFPDWQQYGASNTLNLVRGYCYNINGVPSVDREVGRVSGGECV